MINDRVLVTDMAAVLARIPELMAILAPTNPIVAYVDRNPEPNSVMNARYQMQPGSVMLAWLDTMFQEGQVNAWAHTVEIYVKALENESDLDVVNRLVNGVPVPGDGQVWRNCGVTPGAINTIIRSVNRVTDEEHLDSVVITTETLEEMDYLPAGSKGGDSHVDDN